MKRVKQEIPSWILSSSEENKLLLEEKRIYYEKLKEFCISRKLGTTTAGATTVAPKLKKMVNKIAKGLVTVLAGGNVEIVSDGQENIPAGAVIFANTHQGILDNFCWISENPKHSILLHAADVNKVLIASQLCTGLVLVSKKEEDVENRKIAKLDMMTLLHKGHSVWYFPEGTWNLSPNKLHLPMSFGFLDIAKKTGVPIIPVVTEFTYESLTDKERITKVHIRYGQPIFVNLKDELNNKLMEYEEAISSIRWELFEDKGVYQRNNITNWDYINFVKGNYKNLNLGKKDWGLEKRRMRGANQEFYKFQHINDVPWDAWGELCQTEEIERLKRINRKNKI